MWISWVADNMQVFNNEQWLHTQLQQQLWEALIETDKASW